MFQQSRRGGEALPKGVVVATFSTYEQAQDAISKVSETEADLAGLAIVGSDLRLVERILGRLTWGKVAMAGAMRGLGFGAFIGLVYILLAPEAVTSIFLFPLLGLAFGILLGVATHALTKQKRGFASVQQVIAGKYDVVAPNETAGRAQHAIGQRSQPAVSPAAQAESPGPDSEKSPVEVAPSPGAPPASPAPPMIEQLPGPGDPDRSER